jgi:hypothetical protein
MDTLAAPKGKICYGVYNEWVNTLAFWKIQNIAYQGTFFETIGPDMHNPWVALTEGNTGLAISPEWAHCVYKLQLGYLIERNKRRVPGDDRSHASSSDDEFDGFLDARRQVYQDYDEEGFGPILGSSSKDRDKCIAKSAKQVCSQLGMHSFPTLTEPRYAYGTRSYS